ncbi:MAG: hypothetical protein IH614_14060 [Desulfuromonadales bacterium]|nr:hypothetical protein [Desulfuromonadales bacterium]
MLIYAGIDEAGYGPIFGPLVVARTLFAIEAANPEQTLPSLWRLLPTAVCRLPTDRRDRIAVNDSKRLYAPHLGLDHLERGVLAFLPAFEAGEVSLEQLLQRLAPPASASWLEHPCYAAGPLPVVPVMVDGGRLAKAQGRLQRAADRGGVRLLDAKAAVVLEDRFNQLLGECGNKALVAWSLVADHLEALWRDYGHLQPQVVIDRQGGRIYYRELLARCFPRAMLELLHESPPLSRYRLVEGKRSLLVSVQVRSEQAHLPTALASMLAKYLRELLMLRFQAFWRRQAPQVRPTCGYAGDGRRFLREVEPFFAPLGLDRERFVRCR